MIQTSVLNLPKPHKISFISGLVLLQLTAACVTDNKVPPPSPSLSTGKPSQQGTGFPESTSAETKPGNQAPNESNLNKYAFVTQFEIALGKRDCGVIRNLEKQLVAPPESYSNSVSLATLWCNHQTNPQDKEVADKLLEAISQAMKNESPLFDSTFLELMRSEALAASGEIQASRQSQAKAISQSALQFMGLVSGQVLRAELQDTEQLLTVGQQALLREVRGHLADPMTQAAALTKFDEIIAQVPEGPAREKLLMVRLKLFSAIELAFASQLASLEESRLKKEATTTDELIVKVRKMFPSRGHQQRIDSLVGIQSPNKTALLENTNNQCATPPTASQAGLEKSDLTADRAIQLARSALNDGKPGDAVEVLDSLADAQKNDKTRVLRREASQAHIRDLRRKANELYQRGNLAADNQAKLDSLSQCKQILENILSRYPETDSFTRVKIQKFLNSVSENILDLRKAQAK